MGSLIRLLACLTLLGNAFSQYNLNVYHERNCPSGWRYFDYKCYMQNPSSTDYNTARTQCLDLGADMIVQDYRNEMFFIQHWRGNINEWVGLEIESGNLRHTWVDGKQVSETYTRWHSNEPNNGVSYNVAYLTSYYVYDVTKSCCRHVTCEKRANHHDAQTKCASQGLIRDMAKPVTQSTDDNPDRSMTSCSQSCLQQKFSYSARIDDLCVCMSEEPGNGTCDSNLADENKVYYEFTTNTSTDDFEFVISQPEHLTCDKKSHIYYRGSCYYFEQTSKRFFIHMRDAKAEHGPGAKVVAINNEDESRLIDEVLLQHFNRIGDNTGDTFYVGVYDDRNICDEGWEAYNGACFRARENGTVDTYENQRAYCQGLREGADLIWYENSYDRSYSWEVFMPDDHLSTSYDIWLGIYDIDGGKTWRYPMWHDNSGYLPWSSGEGSGTGERCAFVRSTNSYNAYDVQCSDHYKAVCRYNPRERDAANFVQMVNTDQEPVSESYHRFVPNHGYNIVPQCMYHHSSYKYWYQCNCFDSRYAVIEYPAKASNFSIRDGGKVDAFTVVEAEFLHDGGPMSENSVDFGYDGQHDWDSSYRSFTHVTRDLGTQEVVYDTRDFWYQRANGSATYEVVLPLEKAYVSCLTLVDTTNLVECEVAATGQAPEGSVDFDDGSSPVSVELQDSSIVIVGPDIKRKSHSSGQGTNSYAMVMYNTRFTDHGIIQGFEFDAAQPGNFHFVVWRPRCSENQVWCSKSMSCQTIDYQSDVCETVTNWHKVNCGGNKWSLTARACVDGNGNKIAPSRQWYNTFAFSQFDNVGEYITTEYYRRGRHFVTLTRDEMIEVKPGDFLGFIGIDGRLADMYLGTAWTAYASQGTKTYWPEAGVGHWNYEFYLNAYVTTYRHHVVTHDYNDLGLMNVTFTATNDYALQDAEDTTQPFVYELITDLEIVNGDAGRSVVKNVETLFEVNDHPGKPVTYEWIFGDGDSVIDNLGKVNHSFANSGRYNTTVRAYNELSEDIAWTGVLVQAEITQGVYTQFDNSTKLGLHSVFKICIDDGNEVNFTITIGDGSVHPGLNIYDEMPMSCGSGFHDRNTLKCYQRTSSSNSYDTNVGLCTGYHHRAYPAFYASASEFSNAYGIYNSDNTLSGYRREGEQWFDVFGRPVDMASPANPPFTTWWPGQGAVGGDQNCITHYESTGKFHQRSCTDGHHMMCMYEGPCETFSVEIEELGTYDVKVRAENSVSMVEHTFVQYIQNPIEGLKIHAVTPRKFGDTIVLDVSWTSGSMLSAVCHNDENDSGAECANFEFDEGSDGLAGTGTITIALSEYTNINEHKRFVKFTNKISEMTATQTFVVMYEIEEFDIASSHTCAVTLEDTVEYTLTAKQMSHATLTYTFADQSSPSSDDEFTIAEMTSSAGYPAHAGTAKYDHSFTHIYPVEGTYRITVNASNNISWATTSNSIVIENFIRGYKVEKTSPVPIWPGEVARVNFTLIFDPSYDMIGGNPHLLPTAVTQSYKYGHPDCSGIEDIDECASFNGGCEHTCVNTDGSYHCVCNFNHHLDENGLDCLPGNGTVSRDPNDNSTTTTTTTTEAPLMTTPNMWHYMGQTCPEAVHSDTVWVTDSITDDDYFEYRNYGTFEVTMEYDNCISDKSFTFTVDIDQPVMNMTLVSDETILPWGANSTLTTEMTWGSRINLTYDYTDTNPINEIVYDRLYPNTMGHTWDVEGTYYPTVTAVNRVGTWTSVTGPIYVQYILAEALRVETRAIWGLDYPNYNVEVFFDVYLKFEYKDMMPTNVTANVTFGDFIGDTDEIETLNNQYLPDVAQFNTTMNQADTGDVHVWTFSHVYVVGDTYNVTIDFQNWVSTLSIDVEFHAIESIAPLEMDIVTFTTDSVRIDIDIDTEAIDWSYPLHRFVDCPLIEKQTNLPCVFGLRTKYGIPNGEGVPYNITTSTYKPIPTDYTIRPAFDGERFLEIYYGNESFSQEELEIMLTDAQNLRGQLAGEDSSLFDEFLMNLTANPPLTVGCVARLNLSDELINSFLLEDWLVTQEWRYNKSYVMENLFTKFKIPADAIYSYPIEQGVFIHLEYARGTHLTFMFEWGDGFMEYSDVPFAGHRYAVPGVYTCEVTVFNAVSARTISRDINIQRSVRNITMEGFETVTRNRTNKWLFDLGTIGTDACYLIDFKDLGTVDYPVGNRYFFLGNRETCQDYYEIAMAVFPQSIMDLTNEHLLEEWTEAGYVFNVFTSFLFGTLGTFRLTFTGINRVSEMTVVMPVAVTKGPCFKPLVLLDRMNPCEPICAGREKAFYKSQDIELYTAVSYNCTTTKVADHDWKLYLVHDDGSETPILAEDLNEQKNLSLYFFSAYLDAPLRRMVIPQRTLDYGRYKFTLNVTMYDEEIWTMDTMYFQVVKTPLQVSINSFTPKLMDRYKYEENYTMNIIDNSYDPDDPKDKKGWSFRWMCRRYCETFPKYEDSSDPNQITENMSTECNEMNSTYAKTIDDLDDGGCFMEDGYLQSGLFTSETGGYLVVDLTYAYELDLVEFVIEIRKDERVAEIRMYLEITQGMPPDIDSNLCVSNCKEKVNYENIFSMTARIIGGRGTYNYQWVLFRSPVSDFNDPSTERIEKTTWEDNLPTDGSKDTMVATGDYQAAFALEPGFFTLSDVSAFFFVSVMVWRGENKDNHGIVVSRFQVNEPPLPGNCTAFPLNGTAAETKFNVDCTEFYDQHKPVKYKMGSRAKGTTNILWGALRPTARDPTGGSVLGQGTENYNFEVEIFVRAEDGIGGKTVSEPMIIQVYAAEIDFAHVDLSNIGGGDAQGASTMINAMVGGVNSEEEFHEDHDTSNMTPEELAEHEQQLEEERAAKEEEISVFREKLALTLDSLPLSDLEAVSSVNQAASNVAGKPSQMSESALSSLASVGKKSIVAIRSLSGSLDAGSMNEKATEALSCQAGANKGVTYAKAAEARSPELQERKRKRRAAGEVTTDDLSMAIQDTFANIGALVDGLKVPGEGDTVIDTGGLKMAVMKQFANAFDDGKMASGGDGSNGIALPNSETLLGTGNDTAEFVSSSTNNYDSLPFAPASSEDEGNSSSTLPTGQLLQITLTDENGNPLNNTNSTTTPPVSHIFMSRDTVPDPIVSSNTAAKLGSTMISHKIILPKQSSIHVKMRRVYLTQNVSAGNETNVTTTTTPAPIGQSSTTMDPFLANATVNGSYYDDLNLVFVLFFRAGIKPTKDSHDFNCTLPITFYSEDENTTVALGGAMSTRSCEGVWAEDENATCQTHTLNRDVYPLNREIVENDDMTCFIPDTWLDSYDADLKLYVGVSYYYVNATNITGLTNVTWDDFSRGYMPVMEPVEIPPEKEEDVLYEMEVSSSSCKYWAPFYEDYVTDGCEVGPLTQVNLTHCICQLLSPPMPEYDEKDTSMTLEEYDRKARLATDTPGITFGSGISIPINTIDLSNSGFNNLGENPLVFTLMVSIMCLYLCSCIWAAAQDRKDAIKAGVSPLLDNDPRDKYLYEVTVYTGSRSSSGTSAKVSMVFSGEEDETQPRLIFDDKRPVLQSGGVDGFVMATPRSLGSLSHIRVWHDNSGSSPGWFFSRMQVVDMQTLEKYFFILDRWLSAGEDDGIIDRIVPLAGKDELTGFSHLFFTKAKKDLMDGHIWFSIFGKPHKSNFTRVQRLTCCLSLLFATMVGNIFLYRSPTEEEAGTALRLGPISLTIEQILTGILSSLIAFPINVIIVLVFKNTKEPPYDLKRRCCAPCKKSKKRNTGGFAADELAQQAKILDGGASQSRAASFASLSGVEGEETAAVQDYLTDEVKKRNKKFKLPWGFVFVAYFLALCVTGVSFWYTVEVSMTFGPKKSAEWTAAFCTSIVESIFMSQPIKVLGLALFYALVIKKPDSDDDVDPGLEKGQEYLHKHEKQCQKLDQTIRKRLNKYKNIPIPPTEEYLMAARALRQKEMKMMDVLKEVAMYMLFLYLLFMVSYGNRDPATHRLYSSLYSEFHDADYVPDDGVSFDEVSEYNSFWNYCNYTLLPSLWPEPWYDGVVREKGFTADRNSYRVGVPRLRQLRMPSDECAMPMYKYTRECNMPYSLFSEDIGSYYPGWIPVTNESASDYEGPYPGWFWESSSDLDGFPFRGMEATYGGGGFNIELGHTLEKAQKNLNDLKENEWLTPETRAVIIEFVIYNSNLNLFAVSSMTFEFLPTGSVVPVYKMNLIRLDRYIGSYMITVMVSEILTFLYVFYFMYREIKTFKSLGKKYFKSFWNIVEFIVLLLCVLALIMFFCRFALVKRTAKAFEEDPASFVSFQFATTWEEIYGYILSFIIFFATVKFLKLLRFNKKMTMLGMTMMYIGKPLLSFMLALGIVFLAFAQMAYLVYCRLLHSFSTFVSASTTLFTLMLNKFDYKELERANPIFAAIIFVSFTVIVSFMMLSFMITIILDGFMEVTEELKQKENEYEIVSFIVSKFKGAVGLGSGPSLPPMNKEPDCMVSENHAELMDRFDDFEEMFRDFCLDETKGDEPLVAKYEKEILAAKRTAKNRTIYST